MTDSSELPAGLRLSRTTPTFNNETVPAGLLSAHRVADRVWGRLIVHTGKLIFRFESLNARFRKAAVRRGHFPTDQAAIKVLYLTAIERRKNRSNPTGRINGWKSILNTLTIHYGDRLEAANQ